VLSRRCGVRRWRNGWMMTWYEELAKFYDNLCSTIQQKVDAATVDVTNGLGNRICGTNYGSAGNLFDAIDDIKVSIASISYHRKLV
jgi:hypothetical protein